MKTRAVPANAGFTLIEVLLASLILFGLAITVFAAVRSTVSAKEDIDQRTEALQASRAALSMLERDLRASFLSSVDDLGWSPLKAGDPGFNAEDPPATKPASVTIFQGHSHDVFFTARTHQRMYVDSPENEQHFVTFQLNGTDLIRAESAHAVSISDREDPSRFKQFTLLRGVSRFDLSYWDKKGEKWSDTWDTEAEQRDTLPPAIRIQLEYMPEAAPTARRKVEIVKLALIVAPAEAGLKTGAPPASVPAPGAPGTNPPNGGQP